MKNHLIPTAVVPSVRCREQSPAQTARRFRKLLADGLKLRPVGTARRDPEMLLRGYTPKYEIELFGTTIFLTNARQNYYLRFFVAYVLQGGVAHPRLFYKDASLLWRAASHAALMNGDYWIGKGDTVTLVEDGEEVVYSREATTDLPFELQAALETLNRLRRRAPTDERAVDLVVRRGPDGRVEPYADFSGPRRRARRNPRNLVNGDRPVAHFSRAGDPASLRFAPGFEPDLAKGLIETHSFGSKLYGGDIHWYRVLSRNRRIQWLFFAAPRHVWLIPPQATTTELSSFGVRTVDVQADDDLFVPGYEYHFEDDSQDPPVLYSQIPRGFAGGPAPGDPARADASPWLDKLPIVRAFRRRLLASRGRRPVRRRPA